MIIHRPLRAVVQRLGLLTLVLAATSVGAAEKTPPAATPPAATAPAKGRATTAGTTANPEKRKADALKACTERADYIFVRRCQQACQVEAKGKDQAKARQCVADCGKKPERGLFIKDCMARAGFAAN
jgi:hypothetical protein